MCDWSLGTHEFSAFNFILKIGCDICWETTSLQLVNSVLSSLPTYYMCSIKLPVIVIEVIDKHRKNYLWRGSDFRNKGYNLAAWNLVMKPKDKGGLGIINLCLQNDALLIKQLDKFYRKKHLVDQAHMAQVLSWWSPPFQKRERIILVEGYIKASCSL